MQQSPFASPAGRERLAPAYFIRAARVPPSVLPAEFGLWSIERRFYRPGSAARALCGFPSHTILRHVTEATLHLQGGEIVMEDGRNELSRHLPIWMRARGRVLVTGLGLGCVVRGLLASPHIDHIDVVEIDRNLLRLIGREFEDDPRVALHCGDALGIDLPGRWDFAWHDLWVEGDSLHALHSKLFMRFRNRCGSQGAWAFPRVFKRLYGHCMPVIDAPRRANALRAGGAS